MSTPQAGGRVRVTFEGRVREVYSNGAFALDAYTGLTDGMTGEPVESWLCVRPDSDAAPTLTVESLSEPERDPAVTTWDEIRKQVRG